MKIVHGITRTVLLLGPWAVKIPRVGLGKGALWAVARGYLANLSERDWSGHQGMCPVRWSLLGGVVQVYPRCAPVSGDQEIDYPGICGFPIPTDAKPENVGLLAGQLVWVDYDMNWNDCRRCGQPVVDPVALAADEDEAA